MELKLIPNYNIDSFFVWRLGLALSLMYSTAGLTTGVFLGLGLILIANDLKTLGYIWINGADETPVLYAIYFPTFLLLTLMPIEFLYTIYLKVYSSVGEYLIIQKDFILEVRSFREDYWFSLQISLYLLFLYWGYKVSKHFSNRKI